jgi:hypothetical protein
MSKFKNFILQRKTAAFRKSVKEGKMPEQGTFVTLFNNDYKVLTKPDSKIAILEDNKCNKIAYPREAFAKMLTDSVSDTVEKADGSGPRTLAGPNKVLSGGDIGSKAKQGASASSAKAPKAVDPVGTVRNGRKKVVSKKTGNTMWVNIATGEGHTEHNSHEPQELSKEAQAQSKSFFDSLGDKIHSSDKIKLERQMGDLMKLKQKIQNSLDMAHQDDRQKLPEAELSRKQVFSLQDQYKDAFKKFQQSVKESAAKTKKESGSET